MSEWWLYARKSRSRIRPECTQHFEGQWQPRRNGSLQRCTEEMETSHLAFDAFWLSYGLRTTHERPPQTLVDRKT